MRAIACLFCLVANFAQAAPFDLEALKRLPDVDVLEAACAPSMLAYGMPLPASDLLAEAAKLPEDRRALAWLLFLHRAMPERQKTELSLREPAEPLLERLRAALTTAGLGTKAAALAGAERRATSIGDMRFADIALPPAFGSKAELVGDIIAYARRTPALAACLETGHATMSDAARLSALVEGLVASFAAGADPKDLPPAYRTIWLANQYVGEVENGGVGQLFSNAGQDAPETVQALRTIGRPEQADLVAEGIALFGSPYPQGRERLFAREQELDIGDRLDALTPRADAKAVGAAMAAYAGQQGILPR